jgi:transcription elongation factor GreA
MAKAEPKYDPTKEILVTEEGHKKLLEELEYLKSGGRKEIAEQLKEAISYGDLSENSEYEDAKNKQAFLEGQIYDLEQKVKNAKIVKDTGGKKHATVQLGDKVTIKSETDKKAASIVYTLVGATEADPFDNKVSNESPLGQALLHKKVGELVVFDAPKGEVTFKLEKIG